MISSCYHCHQVATASLTTVTTVSLTTATIATAAVYSISNFMLCCKAATVPSVVTPFLELEHAQLRSARKKIHLKGVLAKFKGSLSECSKQCTLAQRAKSLTHFEDTLSLTSILLDTSGFMRVFSTAFGWGSRPVIGVT